MRFISRQTGDEPHELMVEAVMKLGTRFTATPKVTQYVFTANTRMDTHFGANALIVGRDRCKKADPVTL